MLRDGNVANGSCFPRIANSMPQPSMLLGILTAVPERQFSSFRERFHHILRCIPLIIAESRSHANEVGFSSILFSFPSCALLSKIGGLGEELMDITREYVTAIHLKHANAIEKGVRQMELFAYFTLQSTAGSSCSCS